MLGNHTSKILNNLGPYIDLNVFVENHIWYPLLILFLQSVVFFTLVMIIDNFKFNLRDRQKMEES